MSKYESINPYTNQLIKSYPDATQEEIEQALAAGEKLYLTCVVSFLLLEVNYFIK